MQLGRFCTFVPTGAVEEVREAFGSQKLRAINLRLSAAELGG
jgi:hypothetical protein